MKIVVVLLLLVLTRDIGGAAAGQMTAEEKKVQEDKCNTNCLEKKLEPALCKESCALGQRFQTVSIEEADCTFKCSEPQGPATKPCEEGCKKEYEAKVAEITASCNAVCSKRWTRTRLISKHARRRAPRPSS